MKDDPEKNVIKLTEDVINSAFKKNNNAESATEKNKASKENKGAGPGTGILELEANTIMQSSVFGLQRRKTRNGLRI